MTYAPAASSTAAPDAAAAAPRRLAMAIVIINYKTAALTVDCLASLEPEVRTLPSGQVVVVDNRSPDDSADQIERTIADRGWDSWVRLVRAPVNGGFSAGNNAGIRAVEAESYLLLNSDTLVRPGSLRAMFDAMQAHPRVGLLGPRLEWPDGQPQISCFRDITPLTQMVNAARTGPITTLLQRHETPLPLRDEPFEPDWLSFACVLIRGEVIREVGLLDEGFFMYFEDADYCRRARAAGWRVLHWPAAHVVHLRGGSGPVKALSAARKPRPTYYYAARARYLAKFYGTAGLWLANSLWLAGRGVSWARERVGHKAPHTCEREPFDIWTACRRPLRPWPRPQP